MKFCQPVPLLFSVFTVFGIATAKADAFLLISNSESNNIVVFDETTGHFVGDFTTPGIGGLRSPELPLVWVPWEPDGYESGASWQLCC